MKLLKFCMAIIVNVLNSSFVMAKKLTDILKNSNTADSIIEEFNKDVELTKAEKDILKTQILDYFENNENAHKKSVDKENLEAKKMANKEFDNTGDRSVLRNLET